MPQLKRQWRSFTEAREYVRSLGLKKQKDFEEWSKSGSRPADIPGSPAKAYGALWQGWADFLGNGGAQPRRISHAGAYRPFAEARAFIRQLGLRSQKDFAEWSQTNDRPADIPSNPYNAYGTEWTSWADWLGQNGADGFRPFGEARAYARSLGLKTRKEWAEHTRSAGFPKDLPVWPDYCYQDQGWQGWNDWLGTEGNLNRMTLLAILTSLRPVLADLRPAELFAILMHRGVLRASRRHSRAEALRALERLCNTENLEATLAEAAAALEPFAGTAPETAGAGQVDDGTTPPAEESPALDGEDDEQELEPEALRRLTELPRLRSVRSLRAVDHLAEHGMANDEQLLEFLVNSRVGALWQAVLDGDPAFDPERLRTETGGAFFEMIRERFFQQFEGARGLPIPDGYAFRRNGQIAPANLMQRLNAYRLAQDRRIINYSGVGAGKTLAAVYASRILGARLTVIVAVNATLKRWRDDIESAFPGSVVLLKDRGPLRIDPDRPTYVVLNYEAFQTWADELVQDLVVNHRVDLVVLDEIQSIRLRTGAEESRRRQQIRTLVEGAAARNPSLHVLGMSATPVLNDLHEARTLLELVTGQDLRHLPTRPTVVNAVLYHQLLTRHGLRHRPRYSLSVETSHPVIDGQPHLDRLRRVRPRDLLGLEQAVLEAKLPCILGLVRRGTLIFTTFVTGVADRLAAEVRRAGFSVGMFTGDDKSGLDPFLAGRLDVLIGSEPIGTGVDGLQQVANRLIFAALPWTSAHYDQVVGRLHRQGSVFDRIEVMVPLVELRQRDKVWSWDRLRLDRIRFKRTLADAAVDGVIPEGKLPSREEMQAHSLQALQRWIDEVNR
jgi:superfamily II DNA or RNA helicase